MSVATSGPRPKSSRTTPSPKCSSTGPAEVYRTKGNFWSGPRSLKTNGASSRHPQHRPVGRSSHRQETQSSTRASRRSRVAAIFPPCSRKARLCRSENFPRAPDLRGLLNRVDLQGRRPFLGRGIYLAKTSSSRAARFRQDDAVNVRAPGSRRPKAPDNRRLLRAQDQTRITWCSSNPVRHEMGKGQITIRDLIRSAPASASRPASSSVKSAPRSPDLITAMNTGHEARWGTTHANTPYAPWSARDLAMMGDTHVRRPRSAVRSVRHPPGRADQAHERRHPQ